MDRIVGHLDLDYFYAQVEEVENPALKRLPVLVCVYSGRTEDSGVVSTSNYIARKLGVRSGMPISLAKRKLEGKEAALIPMDHRKYESYSERVMEILRKHTDAIEQTGIDEAFFDVTKLSAGNYTTAGKLSSEIKLEVLQKEHLTCSIGVAPNKLIAKLASDFKKPDALTIVKPEQVRAFLGPMPVEKLYGIGPKSARKLNDVGIMTIDDLANKRVDDLYKLFDHKFSAYLFNAANGTDEEEVTETSVSTQMSRMITLKRDSGNPTEVISQLGPAIDDVHEQAIHRGVFFRSISAIGILKDLSIKTRTRTLDVPTNDLATLKRETAELLTALLDEGYQLRRAGVRVSDLSESQTQSSLADFLGS